MIVALPGRSGAAGPLRRNLPLHCRDPGREMPVALVFGDLQADRSVSVGCGYRVLLVAVGRPCFSSPWLPGERP